jgi:hypothetical protein
MKEHGFYFYYRGQDNFFKSDRQRITKGIAREILELLLPNAEISDSLAERVKHDIRKATYEVKELSSGRKYCNICGENFGGYGDFLDNYKYEHHYKLNK